IQTHASENKDEVKLVREIIGINNVEYLHKVGLTGRDVILAHCIWIDDYEMEILHRTGTNVAHCPSANMKLGSGIARVPEMLEKGINVTIGADGAPCNNNLDVFVEMRHASLIQKARLTDPRVLPAREVIRMATVNGAKALGISDIGSIRRGSKADLVLISLRDINVTPFTSLHDPYSTIVYSAKASNVKYTIVDGRIAVAEGRPTIDLRDLVEKVRDIAFKLAEKIVN
ncbi:N-ethylammeline chlorohydrolase, partial [archaeon]